MQEYLNALKLLTKNDSPSVFGLPENIERAWEQRIASKIISEIKSKYLLSKICVLSNSKKMSLSFFSDLDLIKDASFTFNKEKFQKGLTPFITFWKKLNQNQEFLGLSNEDIKNCSSAVKIFITEEFNFALNLIQKIHQCFATLNKICKEQTNPDEKDITIAVSLLNHEVNILGFIESNLFS